MKVSDYIAEYLSQIGVRTVFGYTGGNITCIIDSIARTDNIDFVQNYHEQASAFSANSYAKITHNIGVAIASSGPGAINLISGIANAYYDSLPCLFITGNVNSATLNKNYNVRQSAFQENDIIQMVKGVTKLCVKIDNPNEIPFYLNKAVYFAMNGRKGPVLLDIPHNIQYAEFEIADTPHFVPNKSVKHYDFDVNNCLTLIKKAKAPLILVGGGADTPQSRLLLRRLLSLYKIPVVASLCGLGVLAHNHECFIGFIGAYGNRYANLALHYCDLLLVLGSRIDERQIGGKENKFAPNADILHIDIDKNELNNSIKRETGINCTVEAFLEGLLAKPCNVPIEYKEWLNTLLKWKNRFSVNIDEYSANSFLKYISNTSDSSIVCVDVGNHQMCAAQSYSLNCDDSEIINSGGHGAMGFALPAAIGAYYAFNKAKIICISGDGGFQMNLQELQTIKRDKLPIKIVIINNKSLGMIEAYQQKTFSGRLYASVEGYDAPDFKKIAESFDIKYLKIEKPSDYSAAKKAIFQSPDSIIVEFVGEVGMRTNPIPGGSIIEQLPQLSKEELFQVEREVNK